MSSATLAAVLSGIAVIGGAALGGVSAGWFTIRVKKRKRVQQRRAEVYVDMLAWIGKRMPWLTSEQAKLGQQDRANDGQPPAAGNRAAQASDAPLLENPPVPPGGGAKLEQIVTPALAQLTAVDGQPQTNGADAPDLKKRTTYPDARSLQVKEDTDPETEYFFSLRARVAVFASHDMARAFDNWVDSYRVVLSHAGPTADPVADPAADSLRVALEALIYERAAPQKLTDLIPGRAGFFNRIGVFFKRLRIAVPFWFKTKIRRQRDVSDGRPGCLTRVVEFCASEELRKG